MIFIKETLKSLSLVLLDPSLALILIILGVIFYLKNRKISAMQKMIAGESINSPLELTVSQICLGLMGGIVGSVILSSLGVVFDKLSGVQFIFLVSLVLMVIKPRFICFSYSGALLGFFSLILQLIYPENPSFKIDIVNLMILVGVLHIVEGILVIIDGSRGTIPVFTKKDDKILGGYAMNRYWIIPVALLITLSTSDSAVTIKNAIDSNSFLPLIARNRDVLRSSIVLSIPFMGMLNYSTVTFTSSKSKKVISSGSFIIGYGIVLTFISSLANFGLAGKVVVLILAPLLHELMIKYQNKAELKREPLFYSKPGKIKVLEVVPDSASDLSKIKVNDDILKVNGEYVLSEKDIYKYLKREYGSINLEIKRENEIIQLELKFKKGHSLGLVLVPVLVEENSRIDIKSRKFRDFLNEVKEKQSKLGKNLKIKLNEENEDLEEEDILNIGEIIDEIDNLEDGFKEDKKFEDENKEK